jgi:hypothetical protein
VNGRILTFYSYKGGTGRSMAVANTAWILASAGLRVLALDWDLEAPGLHRYFYPFLPDPDLKVSPGVIDLMWMLAEATMDQEADDDSGWHRELARISPYAVSINHAFPESGTIDFVPAGRQDATYSALVSGFDWNNFYERLDGGRFLEALKRDMRERYDYVLIDSRTGLSDTAGICTVQLPDILVNCFSLGNQAINGAEAVAASVHRQRHEGDLRMFPVPMRVEDGEQDRLDASRDYARALFSRYLTHVADPERYWGEVEIPYKSLYAYEEILATVGDRPRQENTVLAATERVVGYLTEGTVTQLAAGPSERERRALLARFQRTSTSTSTELPSRSAARGPRVFISYTHESAEHFDAVRELWYQLRAGGIDARLAPPPAQHGEDWQILLGQELDAADAILVVASPGYRATEMDPARTPDSLGEEISLIRLRTDRTLAVVLPGVSPADLPDFLDRSSYSVVKQLTAAGVAPLCRQLIALSRPVGQQPNPRPQYPTVDLSTDSNLNDALTSLARTVQQRYKAEAAIRRLTDPFSIPLRWSATDLPVAARGSQPGSGQLREGDQPDLSELLLQLPEPNLVVLGAPGSGKTSTVIQLILDLLARRPKNGLVPVLFNAATWEPDVESLTDWITRLLNQDHIHLTSAARRLVASRAVLPIVDGLDEFPIELRPLALREITLASGDLPMVVTSRVSEYEEAITKSGRTLHSAAVIELKPLPLDAVTSYLAATQPISDQRWERVIGKLRRHPDLPLAQVLSTPLMVELALTAYATPNTDPAELLDSSRFPSAASLTAHLFHAYVPASYQWSGPSEFADPASVSRWLAYLARWMEDQQTLALCWWQLYHAASRNVVRVLLMAAGFLLTVVIDSLPTAIVWPVTDASFGVAQLVGPGFLVVALIAAFPPPRRPRPRIRNLFRNSDLSRSHSPQRTLRTDRITATLLAVWAAAIVLTVAISLVGSSSAVVAIIGFFTASLILPVACVVLLSRSAWAWFTTAKFWLALNGRLPWQLMSFLEDAHGRGILIQSGATYLFRHARLQQQLARSALAERRSLDRDGMSKR